ncbi:MAG TPA: hypothetical protein VFQ44_06510 [Streptosporangiaceae bacterium]|nr:hypothetical protein [Streptosporangiaceae bacterium]
MHRSRFPARMRGTLGVIAVAGILTSFGVSSGAMASSPSERGTAKWQQAIAKLKVPGKGCFTAKSPKVEWVKHACKKAPHRPYPPAHGHHPFTVGNGNDYSAEVSNHISSVVGTFTSVSAGITETGQQNGGGPQVANTYSLQINAKPFATSMCSGAAIPSSCKGWQQFLYSTTYNMVFMQYWLLVYNAACPAGWTAVPIGPDTDCYTNSTASTLSGGPPAVSSLASVTFSGSASSGGNDSVVMTTGSGTASATAADSLLHLANGWNGVEFTIVGDCCDTQANFNAGSSLQVHTTVHHGSTTAPTCVVEGFTGETNNLHLAGTPAIGVSPAPAIASEQTYAPGTAGCSAAAGVGDTHLATFRNLLYDFQAYGDYELATTGPKFVVENRQISGAPSWPNAAVNEAVATRIGNSDVAVCVDPKSEGRTGASLFINHKHVALPVGGRRNLRDGGDVSLAINQFGQEQYLIRGARGDSLTAAIATGAPTHIDVSVGLGRWPETVHGLLANAGTDVTALASRPGVVFHAPFAFNTFYSKYGNSWHVPVKESLLSDCGLKVATGDPANLMYASNLDPKLARVARATCTQAGVKVPALLDACTVDVAVLGTKAAAQIYRNLPRRVTWGKITLPPFGRDQALTARWH